MKLLRASTALSVAVLAGSVLAMPASGQSGTPIYRMTVTSKTAKAINYRQGNTKIAFKGTAYMPLAMGEAKVENKGTGSIALEVKLQKMESTAKFGPPYMTYVLWAISPEGAPATSGQCGWTGTKRS